MFCIYCEREDCRGDCGWEPCRGGGSGICWYPPEDEEEEETDQD